MIPFKLPGEPPQAKPTTFVLYRVVKKRSGLSPLLITVTNHQGPVTFKDKADDTKSILHRQRVTLVKSSV